jgi:broad specificity phosphatase PhoE
LLCNLAGGGDDDEELRGFVLHSQPTYERLHSQRTSDDGPGGDSQALAETQFDGALLSHRPPSAALPASEAEEVGSQPPLCDATGRTSLCGSGSLAEAAAAHKLTPAVHSVDRVQLNNVPASLFPVFRSKRDCKIVYIVRHGESTYNAACSAKGSGWADPHIFDAPLTQKGQSQARALRATISGWDLPDDTLWVTSPLTRAIQTMLLSCPDAGVQRGAGAVCVLPDISEKVFTSGDVGHPAALLRERFPALAPSMADLPEEWWYTNPAHPSKVNCALQKVFQASENKCSVERRVRSFRQWVLARQERVIVAYGHSCYWKAFAACLGHTAEHMPNCGWMKVHI